MRITAPTAILRIRLKTAILRTALPRTAIARTATARTAILRTAPRITTARTSLPTRAEATADNRENGESRIADKLQNAEKSIRYLKERLQETSCNLFYFIIEKILPL